MPLRILLFCALLAMLSYSCNLKALKILIQEKVSNSTYDVSIPLITHDNELKINVLLKNNNSSYVPQYFQIDNMASTSLVKNNVIDLYAHPISRSRKNFRNAIDARGIKFKTQLYTINEIKIDSVSFKNFLVMTKTKPTAKPTDSLYQDSTSCLPITDLTTGIIGNNMIRGAVWHFDIEHEKLRIVDHIDKIELPSKINKRNYSLFPTLDVKINNTTLSKIHIDLGFNDGILLSEKKIRRLKLPDSSKQVWYGRVFTSGSGSRFDTITRYHCNVIVDGDTIPNTAVYTIRNVKTSLIGVSFIRNFDFVIDGKKSKFYYHKNSLLEKKEYAKSRMEVESVKGFGFTRVLDLDDNTVKVYVLTLLLNGLAEKKDLKIGDVIIGYNHKPLMTNDSSTCEQMSELGELIKKQDPLTLEIRRGSSTFHVIL